MCVTVWTPEGVELDSQGQLFALIRKQKPDAVLLSAHGGGFDRRSCLCTIDVAGTLEAAGMAYEIDGQWGDYRVLAAEVTP